MTLPEPEIHARATSTISLELVDFRLATLKGKTDAASWQERKYLKELRLSRYPDAPPPL